MSLYISSLNSGSNANCYYVGNSQEAVLIDAGLSCRETEKRMKQLGLAMDKVKAIFVSHEHSDHITGVPGISKKFQLPVYITEATHKNCRLPIEPHLIASFNHAKPVVIGNLSVFPFRKSHDAQDPHSFLVSGHGVNVGVIIQSGTIPAMIFIRSFKYFNSPTIEYRNAVICFFYKLSHRLPYSVFALWRE